MLERFQERDQKLGRSSGVPEVVPLSSEDKFKLAKIDPSFQVMRWAKTSFPPQQTIDEAKRQGWTLFSVDDADGNPLYFFKKKLEISSKGGIL